jgi:large repetitive protein
VGCGYPPTPGPANLVTLDSAPFSRNDPWLASGATRTQGNNVEAFANKLEPDGFGPAGSDECNVALPVDGDLHACVTSPDTFDHLYNPLLTPDAKRTQAAAAVTNLFYTINYLHDWFYDAGFNEAAGNAQTSNFGRGGFGNDSILAEAQDFSGSNNANMNTPPDGTRPRMRMYLWSSGLSLTKVQSPPALAGVKSSSTAEFGAQAFDLTASLALTQDALTADGPLDTDACTTITNPAAVAGKIAVIDRGTCLFVVKVRNAQDAGATGVVIVNNVSPGTIGMSGSDATITIPSVSVTQADGEAIKTALRAGTAVVFRMARQFVLPRDGSFDNTLVAHEWGHYLSNRLINDANGLSANQARGMGEGWADFVALLMFVKEEDRNVPANANFGGTYGVTPYPLGGPDYAPDVLNDAYYYGIRRYPYSRDLSKNPLTFKHIADATPLPATPPISTRAGGSVNSEVHNTGEVWSSMLWECYSNLLNDTPRLTFAQAQDRMKRYLVASLKMTPMDPTFVQARDALLAVMQAQDATDADLCLTGFAKRGLGAGAIAPDNFSEDNAGVIESFSKTSGGGTKVLAIEYYHAAFDHYFVTAIADEITKLDNGTFTGWVRTGETFNVYADVPGGSSPVCRFFSTAFGAKSSHFYTPDGNECTTVKANANWQFEAEVFSLPRPNSLGVCATGAPVYRLYNNGLGGAPNHRYTTSLVTRTTMLNKGWISEGSGNFGVIMCSPT